MPFLKEISHVFSPSYSLRRLLAFTTAIALALPAYAQDASNATPPTRVGQVADVSGSVSYNGAGSNGQWVAATPNYPVTAGDSLFTQDGAQASLVLDSSRLTFGPNTELQVTALDDNNFTATESQGEVFLNLANLQQGQNFTLHTPRGAVNISESGEYDIAAGDADTPTTVSVLAGAATIGQLQIPAGQEGFLSGTDQTTAQLGPLQRDDFTAHVLAEMAPPPPPYAPPVVQQMTGVNELSNYGTWDQSPQYGAVWYPTVAPGWAPYREGHWAYVAPWGWTWVDVEPWGFAPFHYGRWISNGGRWCWVPAGAYAGGGYGPAYQPVYAPAVVGFFGLAAGVAITAAILSSGSVGWVPLAPGEAYYPYYHSAPDYLRRINRVDVRNYTQINIHNSTVINNYANRRAATYIPASAMARGEPVSHFGHPVPDKIFAQARPVQGNFNQTLRPDISHRFAPAPHPTDFAQRHNVPPQIISHMPVQPGIRPQGAEIHQNFPTHNNAEHSAQTFHPENPQAQHPENMPVFHPQTPAQQFHPQMPQQQFHHENAPIHPQVPEQARPQMPQVVRPQMPQQQFHHENAPVRPQPSQQQFHPQQQQFHPQEMHQQQPRPQMPQQQFHPQSAPHPQATHQPNEAHQQK
jgi:hypothetical protein